MNAQISVKQIVLSFFFPMHECSTKNKTIVSIIV